MKNYQVIIDKINQLYITQRKSYLVLNREGIYSTFTKDKNSPMALNDTLIKQHLEGNHTIGVFSGSQFSKFICFDLDMIDKNQTKWMTNNLMNVLNDLGFSNSDIHIANSGNKGMHLLIFSSTPIQLSKFKDLFILAMEKLQSNLCNSIISTLHKGNELTLEINNICNIEFRPTNSQGVKIELGHNFKNKSLDNKCLFLDKETFHPITSNDYFLSIEPCDSDLISIIVEENSIINEGISLVKSSIKESYGHKINRDESETIDFIQNLLINGMNTSGSRNNSVFKLARYFSYCGFELEETIVELKDWMLRQDKKYYKSPIDFCLLECERIAKNVYDKGYTLVGKVDNLKIYKSEMIEIMKIKEKNTKLIMFSLLLHSKRFATKNGSFYMTYNQIEEMCGLGYTSAFNNISILEELGMIEVIERNIKQKGTYVKRPNKYKVNLLIDNKEEVIEIDNSNTILVYSSIYYKTVTSLFSDKDLRQFNTSNRQYREFKKYRNLSA